MDNAPETKPPIAFGKQAKFRTVTIHGLAFDVEYSHFKAEPETDTPESVRIETCYIGGKDAEPFLKAECEHVLDAIEAEILKRL